MASQFDQARVVVQPQAAEQPISVDVFDRQSAFLSSLSQAEFATSSQAFSQASAAFEKTLDIYGKEAAQRAADDAPASIKYDGSGNIIPPSSFYPPGITTRAYAESFRPALKAHYRASAEQELINYSAEMKAKFPADSTAYAAAMTKKRQAMQQNLAPEMAPWIDLRGEQIQAQGISQIAVVNQGVANAATKEQADRTLAGVKEDAGRLAANTPIAQGGGGSQAGYDNNVGNITQSADPYKGGKSLPLKGASGLTFETFQTAEHGVAASYNLIERRVKEAGGNLSFTDLVNKWDPKAAPDVKANYAAALAKAAGVNVGDNVPIDDATKMAEVIKAQNKFEKGKQTVPDSAFLDGVKLGKGDDTITPKTQPATGEVRVADPAALKAQADLAINSAALKKRLDDYETLAKAAGTSPAEIQRNKDELAYDVQIRAMSEQIKNSAGALYGRDGIPNPGAVAAAQDGIRTIAARYPGREKQVTDALQGALDYAVSQASRQAQQIQVNDQRAVEPKQRKMMADAAAARAAALADDTVTAQTITRNLEAAGRGYLNDSSLSDSVAMKLGQTAFSTGAVSRGALQESFNTRISGLNSIIASPTSTPEQRERANAELLTIGSDPAIRKDLTASQMVAVQAGIDQVAGIKNAQSFTGMAIAATEGKASPEFYQKYVADEAAAGRVGNWRGATMTPEQALNLVATGTKNYNEKQAQLRASADGLAAVQEGREPTKTQADALDKTMPFKLRGAEQSFAIGDPAEQDRAIAHYNATRKLPDQVKEAFAVMPKVGNEETFTPYMTMANKILGQLKAQGLDAKDQQAALSAMIGSDKALQLGIIRDYGIEEGNKAAVANATTSKTGQAGQSDNAAANSISAAGDRFLGSLNEKGASGDVLSRILQGRLAGESWKLTPQERAARAVFETNARPDVAAPNLMHTPPKMTYRADVQQDIAQLAAIKLATQGKDIAMMAKGETPEDYAWRTAYEERKQLYQPVPQADGTLQLQFKPLGSVMAEKMGRPSLSEEAEKGILQSIVLSKYPGRETEIDPMLDWSKIKAVTEKDENGQISYRIASELRNGMIVNLDVVAPNDPRLDATRLHITDQADREMRKHWNYQVGANDGLIAFAAGTTANMMMAPFAPWIRGNKIETLAAANQGGGFANWWARQMGDMGDFIHGPGSGAQVTEAMQKARSDRDKLEANYIRRYGALWDLGHQLLGGKDVPVAP